MEMIKGKWSTSCQSNGNFQVFLIKEKQDAVLFKLTWVDEMDQVKLPNIN
jgi:hypothetical protein